ncbi:hypothetical protein FK088_23680 [Salmonella enterica]|nr:hypothetical protein [Salmonella enterica]EBI1926871.1 hypothetical protein [Salmonella enterica]
MQIAYKKFSLPSIFIFGLFLLAGCDGDGFTESAKKQVKTLLKDPSSAQFDSVEFHPSDEPGEKPHGAVCGKVNSKNSFGAYTGYKRFVMGINTKDGVTYRSGVQMEDGSPLMSGVYDMLWKDKCE